MKPYFINPISPFDIRKHRGYVSDLPGSCKLAKDQGPFPGPRDLSVSLIEAHSSRMLRQGHTLTAGLSEVLKGCGRLGNVNMHRKEKRWPNEQTYLTGREQACIKHQLHTLHFVYILYLMASCMGALVLELDHPSSKFESSIH